MAKNKRRSAFFRMVGYTRTRWFIYYLGLFGSGFVGLGFSYVFAMAYKGITDAAISGDMGSILNKTIRLLIQFALLMVANSFTIYSIYANSKKINSVIRRELFAHIQKLPMSYFENQHSGDLVSRLTNDINGACIIYGDPFHMVVRAVISGIGSGMIIFSLNWKMGIATIIIGVLNIFVNIFFVKPLKEISKKVQSALSALNQRFSDSLVGIHVIKIFNLKNVVFEKYSMESLDALHSSMKRVRLNTRLDGVNTLMGYLNYSGMIVAGSFMVAAGQLTIGTLVAVVDLMGSFFHMFRRLGEFVTRIQSCLACAERIFEVLDTPAEDQMHAMSTAEAVTSAESSRNKSSGKEERQKYTKETFKDAPVIEFRDISFGYSDQSRVLDNFSLKVCKGQVVAIAGSSGSGKSTLFKLLLNYYEQNEGEILLFNKSFRDYEQKDIRKAIAYVPQDNYLFNGTIKENIAFGKPGATNQEIIEAAEAAYANDFITRLPKGYDTEVGDRGTHLSGGERQRIAIARALLKDAPILLLDEATSSLDSESEQQIQKALEVLMKGRTTMVIAHRLSTIQNADRILVVDNGRICEEGRHDELLALDRVYAKLYNMQFRDVDETMVCNAG